MNTRKNIWKTIFILLLLFGVIALTACAASGIDTITEGLENGDLEQAAADQSMIGNDPKGSVDGFAETETVPDCSVRYEGAIIALDDTSDEIISKLDDKQIPYTMTDEYIGINDPMSPLDMVLELFLDENDRCVRIRWMYNGFQPQTPEGLHLGDSFDKMIECYGDNYTRTVYSYKGFYEVYRYFMEDFILEIHMGVGDLLTIANLDIYKQYLFPVYDEEAYRLEIDSAFGCYVQCRGIPISIDDDKEWVIQLLNDKNIPYAITGECITADSSLCLYFDENNKCVRMSLMDEKSQTVQGLHLGDRVDKMVASCGEEYTKIEYRDSENEIYEVYRYVIDDPLGNVIFEFRVEDDGATICNIDFYRETAQQMLRCFSVA